MKEVAVSDRNPRGLPQCLLSAQEAIHLPEVQEMLHRLAAYRLGIYMPHMHDAQSGTFLPLADEVTQVESGLQVSFQPSAAIAKEADRYLPVGWVWRDGAPATSAVCEMVREEQAGNAGRYGRYDKHKMARGN